MPTNNEQLLESYRSQLAEIEKKMAALRREQQAVATIVQGLELLTGKKEQRMPGTNITARFTIPSASGATLTRGSRLLNFGPDSEPKQTAIELAIQAMRTLSSHKTMGAADIHRLIRKVFRFEVNYQTLYKSLKRLAEKEDGAIYKKGGRFGLREWLK